MRHVIHNLLHQFNQPWRAVSNHRQSPYIPEVRRGQEDSRQRTRGQKASCGYGPGSRMNGQHDAWGKSSGNRKEDCYIHIYSWISSTWNSYHFGSLGVT